MASMATMGHCSIYVVLLQTAVEGPGFADAGQQRPAKTNEDPQKSPKVNAGQQGPTLANKDPWKPMKVGPNDARHVVWALCKFFFLCFFDTNVLLYIMSKVQNT